MKLLLDSLVGKFIGCGEVKLSWGHGDYIAGPSQVGGKATQALVGFPGLRKLESRHKRIRSAGYIRNLGVPRPDDMALLLSNDINCADKHTSATG